MIKGVHTMFFSSEPEALRAFLRDRLGFSSHTDVGGGWLIFDLPEADMGVHPSDERGEHGQPAGTHDISFYCEDLRATIEELEGRGVEFDGDVVDAGFGLTTHFRMPGGVRAQLYQPHYRKRAGFACRTSRTKRSSRARDSSSSPGMSMPCARSRPDLLACRFDKSSEDTPLTRVLSAPLPLAGAVRSAR